MTSMAFAPPPSRSRPPRDPPPHKSPLLRLLCPFEPLEPPDPPDPPDVSPALRCFIFTSASRRLSSTVHLVTALYPWLTCLVLSLMTVLTSNLFHETCTIPPPATSISWPIMYENCFSSESLEDIYSGTFAKRLLVGFEAASPLRSFLISHQDLFVPVPLPCDAVGFYFLRSSLWTDLLFHRYVPPSSTLWSTTTLLTGKHCSNLFWREGRNPSSLVLDLAISELFCGPTHTDDDRSMFISLLDHNDQRLGFDSIKSSQPLHDNAGVGSPCLESNLVPSEVGLNPISLSAGVRNLLPHQLGFRFVSSQDIRSVSENSYWHELTMCISRPKLTALISRHRSVSTSILRTQKLVTNNTIKPSFEESFSITIEFLQQLHLCSRCKNFNPDVVSYLLVGKLERLSLIDLSFLEKFISISSHRGWERLFTPFSSFRERHFPSLSSYTESSTTSTNRCELLTPLVTSPLTAETLAFNNVMISAHSCGFNSLSLEALIKKLPVFVYDSNRLTYPFNALIFFNVTNEFHSLALNSLFVIFS